MCAGPNCRRNVELPRGQRASRKCVSTYFFLTEKDLLGEPFLPGIIIPFRRWVVGHSADQMS